jgi:hypothetical protein
MRSFPLVMVCLSLLAVAGCGGPRIRGGSNDHLPNGNFYVLRLQRPDGELAVAAVYPFPVDVMGTLDGTGISGNGDSVSKWHERHTIRFSRTDQPASLELRFSYDSVRKTLEFRGKSIPLTIGQLAVIRFDQNLDPTIEVIDFTLENTVKLKREMGEPQD